MPRGLEHITDSIDELVRTTLQSSKVINKKAQKLSRIATAETRAASALIKFEDVYKTATNAQFICSLEPTIAETHTHHNELMAEFKREAKGLNDMLRVLHSELRTAQIISTMLSVEASQAGEVYQDQLNSIATSVSQSANSIQSHVLQSLNLFSELTRVVYASKSSL